MLLHASCMHAWERREHMNSRTCRRCRMSVVGRDIISVNGKFKFFGPSSARPRRWQTDVRFLLNLSSRRAPFWEPAFSGRVDRQTNSNLFIVFFWREDSLEPLASPLELRGSSRSKNSQHDIIDYACVGSITINGIEPFNRYRRHHTTHLSLHSIVRSMFDYFLGDGGSSCFIRFRISYSSTRPTNDIRVPSFYNPRQHSVFNAFIAGNEW